MIGVDTQVARDFERLADNLGRIKLGVFDQGACRRLSERAAGSYGDYALLWFQHIAITGDRCV